MRCDGNAWVVTYYPDGTQVHAHPQHGPEDEARAVALGYVSVGPMTYEHDQLHTRLAHALGLKVSPTLHGVATGRQADPAVVLAEEVMVLAAARFLNLTRSDTGGNDGPEAH